MTASSDGRRLRVFISYSREDAAHAARIAKALRSNRLEPLWDDHLVGGEGFTEQIKTLIAHAHVFLPVITEGSSSRGWVHQEIGFATALGIPVLPVCVGRAPEGIIQSIQGVQITAGEPDLRRKLSRVVVERAATLTDRAHGMHQVATDHTNRAALLDEYCTRLSRLGRFGMVRQDGQFTSLSIPDVFPGHAIWGVRYGKAGRTTRYIESIREERRAVQEHIQVEGARLVITVGSDYGAECGPQSYPSRLLVLIQELERGSNISVALRYDRESGGNVTTVGDYFLAATVYARSGGGYEQTSFTRHAETVRNRIEAFDETFDYLLERDGVQESDSRRHALEVMRERYAAARRKVRNREHGRLLDAWTAGEASLVRTAKRKRP